VFNDLVDYMLGAEHTKRLLVGRIDQNRAQLMQAGVSNVTPQPIGVWNDRERLHHEGGWENARCRRQT
jgi:hypothetical protein